MKKLMMMIVSIAMMAGLSQAASVTWNSGAILNPETGLTIGATTGIYLAQIFFYTDAAGTVPFAAGAGAQISDSVSSLSAFSGTTASVFPASTAAGTWYAQMVITSTDGNWTRTSELVALTAIPPSGNLTLNFTSGAGTVDGIAGGTTWPTTDDNGWDPVPEPTSIALLVLGVTAIGLRRRVRTA